MAQDKKIRINAAREINDGKTYFHGYLKRESERLSDQAQTLTGLMHDDTRYPADSRVLEAGCGIGSQTVILAKNSTGAFMTVDISPESIRITGDCVRVEGIPRALSRHPSPFVFTFIFPV